jgi:transcriptional regulator with XRE-family HTH domain
MPRMDDLLFGRAIRLVRVKRRWRQEDLAIRAGVSRAAIWRAERGRIDELTIAMLRRICEPLEIRVELLPRGRGTDLERLVNARHSALHESVARALATAFPAWEFAPEVSFNIYGERGVIDLILWHPGRRALLIIEFKTELVDTGDLLSTMDRRRRLASEIVAKRGWVPRTVSTWVVVARSRTNERRIADHQAVLRSAFPDDERDVMRWLADPDGTVNGLSMWRSPRGTSFAPTHRVHRAASR